ncbi:MAG TPA: sulfotransferase family 2 domain-containing protein [Casimicrobiaceae bacterium]|nr:sulfotransferase family 2 domain-containing protein [Casimicrobiaceae bacterium]
MIISHTHRYIFVKSWKTAGTSIESALSQHCSGSDVVTALGDYWFNRDEQGQWIHRSMNDDGFSQHDSAEAIKGKLSPEIWNGYFKFSIARNPWDRLVSLFSWEARNKPALKPVRRWYHRAGFPFNEFRARRELFREFVNGDWKTNDRFYVMDGRMCLDFVMRYERLAEDLGELCRRVGLPEVALPHLKSGLRQGGHRYAEYYDEPSKAIVAERHERDISLFGYEF